MNIIVESLQAVNEEIGRLWIQTANFSLRDRGAFFTVSVLAIYIGLSYLFKRKTPRFFRLNFDYILKFVMGLVVALSILYLFYPSYSDHIEATIAGLGRVMEAGTALYPYPDLYPYHGIIYGPALAEIQGLARHTGFEVTVASKLPGILAFMASVFILFSVIKSQAAKGYFLFMIPFLSAVPYAVLPFWNRSESFIWLLIFLSIAAVERLEDRKILLPLLLGVFMGAASALKIHGVLYLLPLGIAAFPKDGKKAWWFLGCPAAALAAYLCFFIPANVSLVASVEYLLISSKHGLSLDIFYHNLVYLAYMFVPFAFFSHRLHNLDRFDKIKLALVAGIELSIAIIGAKNGAGSYHLLPLVAANAWLIERYLAKNPNDCPATLRAMYAIMLFPCFTALYTFEDVMRNNWEFLALARAEVVEAAKRYPGIVMGISDDSSFNLMFLRSLLPAQQIDYSVFMDLKHAGYGDDTFAHNLETCSIPYLLMPNVGIPFAMKNVGYEPDKLLMSDSVRAAFTTHYRPLSQAGHFSVYECHNP